MYTDIYKKNLRVFLKWFFYMLLLCFCYILQSVPYLFALAQTIKPVLIVSVCVAVAACEFEYSGAIFAAMGGMLWDISSGRQAGFFSLVLMLICFLVGLAIRVYFRNNFFNVMVFTFTAILLVLCIDFLFGYIIYNYPGKSVYFFSVLFPTCIYTSAVSPIFLFVCKKIHARFTKE